MIINYEKLTTAIYKGLKKALTEMDLEKRQRECDKKEAEVDEQIAYYQAKRELEAERMPLKSDFGSEGSLAFKPGSVDKI